MVGRLVAAKKPKTVKTTLPNNSVGITKTPTELKVISPAMITTAALTTPWQTLEFCGAVSVSNDVESRIGRALSTNDIMCQTEMATHSNGTRYQGWHASCSFLPPQNFNDMQRIGCGQGLLGKFFDREGKQCLLFGTKALAISHYLLCLIVLPECSLAWRQNYCSKVFPCGSDLNYLPLTNSGKVPKGVSMPYLTLVRVGPSGLRGQSVPGKDKVYACTLINDYSTSDKESLVFFPFNF